MSSVYAIVKAAAAGGVRRYVVVVESMLVNKWLEHRAQPLMLVTATLVDAAAGQGFRSRLSVDSGWQSRFPSLSTEHVGH